MGVVMSSQRRKLSFVSTCCVLCVLVFCVSNLRAAEVVTIPLTLDEQLLTALLVDSAFTGKGRSAEVLGQEGDCIYVKLANPQYRIENNLLKLEMALSVRGGTEIGGKCLFPLSWQGYLVLWQKPVFASDEFSLSFKIKNSTLLSQKREPAKIAGFVWDLVKPNIYEYLERIEVDLAPPVSHLQTFLGPLFKKELQATTSAMLGSLHRGEVYVIDENLTVELLAEVEETYQPADVVTQLTPEERSEIIELWERWDAFLVHLISIMAHGFLEPEDRQLLMDALLESRYAFSAALEEPELKGDLVRLQFLDVWKNLSPLFRSQLATQPVGNSLGFLAFFTAGDALTLFDAMGPAFGIELSQEGLLYLAEMLSGKSTPLPYLLELDGGLRDVFELKPQDKGESPVKGLKEIDIPEDENQEPLSFLLNFLVTPARAAGGSKVPGFSEILKWKVPADPYPEYVTRVRDVLGRAADGILAGEDLPSSLKGIFAEIIPAIAWQESCFRQFVVKKKKLTYLLSYNGSSVGVMQINERIWRGLYDRERLRWDIDYNAMAGCEIVALYLNRYVLRDASWVKGDKPKLLSRLLYSMYNGGPGQYKKFLQREKTGKHYKSDQLFAEKLEWSMKKEWNQITRCL
jgi:Transglycosylase SLT domain